MHANQYQLYVVIGLNLLGTWIYQRAKDKMVTTELSHIQSKSQHFCQLRDRSKRAFQSCIKGRWFQTSHYDLLFVRLISCLDNVRFTLVQIILLKGLLPLGVLATKLLLSKEYYNSNEALSYLNEGTHESWYHQL